MTTSELAKNCGDLVKTTMDKFIEAGKLFKSKDTPLIAKIILGFALGYMAFPIDIIPDFIPVIGKLDDVLILLLGLWLAERIIKK